MRLPSKVLGSVLRTSHKVKSNTEKPSKGRANNRLSSKDALLSRASIVWRTANL